MRKVLATIILGIVFATTVNADFTRVEMGAGVWAQTPNGDITYGSAKDSSDTKQDSQGYAWLLIKHPIPVLPNLRVEYSIVSNSGKAIGTFKKFTATSSTKTNLDITQFDVIPYYNILDNTPWLTIDLGIDVKLINAKYKADNTNVGTYTESASIALPLVYARGRVEIPSTGFGIESDIKYVTYNSNTVYDARVKVDYTFDIKSGVQPGLEVGYRTIKVKTDATIDLDADIEFSGVYAGIMLRF